MNKAMQLALGLITSIGGFLEIGSVTTAAQAGASFGYQLLWAIAIGTIDLIFLVEMSGRLSAVSRQTVVDALRSRFGFRFYTIVLVALAAVTFLVLVAELGGVALSMHLLTRTGFQWWALPCALLTWLLLWRCKLDVIENGVSLLGLITVCFAIAAVESHPDWHAVLGGTVPSIPHHDGASYWFIAVSILGASISPYLVYFYSSGAVEDHWDVSYLGVNRFIAGFGMMFGGLLSMAVLIVAAVALQPKGIEVQQFDQAAMLMQDVFPRWGVSLFAFSMAFACLGAALETALAISYLCAEGLGWNWSQNDPADRDARFSLTYTAMIALASVPLLAGVNAVRLTTISMALTAVALPFTVAPFLVLMNDRVFCGEHRNGWFSNTVVVAITLTAFVLAAVAIPLQILGG